MNQKPAVISTEEFMWDNLQTIGILQTDEVSEDLRDKFSCYPDMFKSLFFKIAPHLNFKVFDVTKYEKPEPIGQCDGYIITGSKAGVYESQVNPWIDSLLVLIRNISTASIPQAGICFGHQALAVTFGGKVVKSSKGWGVGVHDYSLLEGQNTINKILDKFSIIATHQDQVIEKPKGAQLLAGSQFCPIGALVSYSDKYISFQGHPEFSKEYFLNLMDKRIDKIGKENINYARKTINEPINSDLVAMTILDFFVANGNTSNKAIND